MARVIAALNKRLDFPVPFHAVVAANREYALKDFWRDFPSARRQRRATRTSCPTSPVRRESNPNAFEQARVFAPYLDGLCERDRELLTERMLLGLTPQQSADRRGIPRGTLDTRYSRALNKAREKRRDLDVRNPDEGAA